MDRDDYWGFSRYELRSNMLVLLKAVQEMAAMYNEKAEADRSPTLKTGKLERFIARVERLR